MNFKGKRLLILGGGDVHKKVVNAAKEMGIYTIVTDYYTDKDAPAKKYADEKLMISVVDVDGIVNWCRNHPVDGILNFCNDPAQAPYQRICEQLGLPCFGNKMQFEIMTNKRLFKQFCSSNGCDVIPEYTVEDITKDRVLYPILVKPSDSRGSRGQSICYNKADALEAVKIARLESKEEKVICEKYMREYQDIASAYFVINGEPYLIKFGDRFLGREEDKLNRLVMCTLFPSRFSNHLFSTVVTDTKEMIKKLGIKFGPVFLQGFLDGHTIRYYDPGLRMPGSDYDIILKKATGFDTVKTMIHFALTGDESVHYGNPLNSYLLCGGKAVLLDYSTSPCRIDSIEGAEKIQSNKNVVYFRQIRNVGSDIPDSGDMRTRVAEVGAYLQKNESMKDFIRHLYSIYHVYDNYGNDRIVSKIDVEKIFREDDTK